MKTRLLVRIDAILKVEGRELGGRWYLVLFATLFVVEGRRGVRGVAGCEVGGANGGVARCGKDRPKRSYDIRGGNRPQSTEPIRICSRGLSRPDGGERTQTVCGS